MRYDFIGDIHGHADTLEVLLKKLDYQKKDGVYSHSDRQVIFLGDLIDRGPKILETLEIVKAMVDNGSAFCLMGNHEYNALAFNTPRRTERSNSLTPDFLRPHTDLHVHQHSKTLSAFRGKEELWQNYLKWFYELPLLLETSDFVAVHAAYLPDVLANASHFSDLKIERSEGIKKIFMNENFLHLSHDQIEAVDFLEITLKGPEVLLPMGASVKDKDGHSRQSIRVRWWEKSTGLDALMLSADEKKEVSEVLKKTQILIPDHFFPALRQPTFFGHYWMRGEPELLSSLAACLDWSIARGGAMAAYRFHGEHLLTKSNLVWVQAV